MGHATCDYVNETGVIRLLYVFGLYLAVMGVPTLGKPSVRENT
ncbi:hypothetical protein LV79_006084 [Actinokineospora globicatena]|nr:hypothetical protein [Actinokineospora globicatena]